MREIPTTLHEFAAGDESDLNIVLPWTGPAIDPETGELRAPLPEEYLVATSVGWPKPGREELGGQLNGAILQELWTRDGLLAATVAVSENNFNAARNLVLWRDKEALMAFLRSPVHMDAARQTRGLMFDWEGANWTGTSRTELPTFAEARARLDAARGAGESPYASHG
ncbi:DUF3291 domain-containing protein [Streptomyces sp. NPDC006430]|uniref:DUF3291 domain-containing protein n=1 Tax=Streptomyces sp. NPDC006430 TaxID=3154299 RepID=UPI0033B26D08